jgi:hypothetical protein
MQRTKLIGAHAGASIQRFASQPGRAYNRFVPKADIGTVT